MTQNSDPDVVVINPAADLVVINPAAEEAVVKVEYVIVDAAKETTRVVIGTPQWDGDPLVVDPAI